MQISNASDVSIAASGISLGDTLTVRKSDNPSVADAAPAIIDRQNVQQSQAVPAAKEQSVAQSEAEPKLATGPSDVRVSSLNVPLTPMLSRIWHSKTPVTLIF